MIQWGSSEVKRLRSTDLEDWSAMLSVTLLVTEEGRGGGSEVVEGATSE